MYVFDHRGSCMVVFMVGGSLDGGGLKIKSVRNILQVCY